MDHPKMRNKSQASGAILLRFDQTLVARTELFPSDPINQYFVRDRIPSGKSKVSWAMLFGAFGYSHQQHDPLFRSDGAGVEHADHLQVLVRGRHVGGSEQAGVKEARQHATRWV